MSVRPAILWNDQRTAAECDGSAAGRTRALHRHHGQRPLTGFTAPKLLWVRNHEPEAWARARHMLLPKDYVRLHLTGEHALDVADGAGTVLFDLAARLVERGPRGPRSRPAMLPRTVEGPTSWASSRRLPRQPPGCARGPGGRRGRRSAANAVGLGAVRPGIGACRSERRASCSHRPRSRPSSPRGSSTRSAIPCRARGTSWASRSRRRAACAGSATHGTRTAFVGQRGARGGGAAGLRRADLPPVSQSASGRRIPIPWLAARSLVSPCDMVSATRAGCPRGVAFGLRDASSSSFGRPPPSHSVTCAIGWRHAKRAVAAIVVDVLGVPMSLTGTSRGPPRARRSLASVGAGWHPKVEATRLPRRDRRRHRPGPDRGAYESAYKVIGTYPALRVVHPARGLRLGPSAQPASRGGQVPSVWHAKAPSGSVLARGQGSSPMWWSWRARQP